MHALPHFLLNLSHVLPARPFRVATKTKAIKQMTIKALEPEIQQIISKGKAELKQAELNAQVPHIWMPICCLFCI